MRDGLPGIGRHQIPRRTNSDPTVATSLWHAWRLADLGKSVIAAWEGIDGGLLTVLDRGCVPLPRNWPSLPSGPATRGFCYLEYFI